MQELMSVLFVIFFSGWVSGTIYPASIFCKNTSRWIIFIGGFIAVSIIALSLDKSSPNEEYKNPFTIAALMGAVWICASIIGLITHWVRLFRKKPASHTEPSNTEDQPEYPIQDDGDYEGSDAVFLFMYQDSKGNVTERSVSALSVGRGYLRGICHLRSGIRTFKLERIIGDVVDTATGEIIPVSGLSRYFRSHY